MNVKRSYSSSVRREQAAATRQRLLDCARELFGRQGYSATTIREIADSAGVSVQTFYAVHGSKRQVLLALLDEMEAQAELPALRQALEGSAHEPAEQLRLIVDFNVSMFHQASDILEIVRGAGTEADPGAMSRVGDARRRAGQRAIVEHWADLEALRAGLEVDEAADVLWALSGPESFHLFVDELRWSTQRYRDWLRSTLHRELLT
jgi:AcrR family transcriptional regulator